MIINLNEMVPDDDKDISFSETLVVSPDYNFYNNSVLVNVKGTITKKNNMYLYNGALNTTLNMICDSCLKPVDIHLEFPISEKFSEEEVSDEEDEVWPITNKSIELAPATLSNLYLNIPVKVVCMDNCKGLCPLCGIDLNIKECSCDTTITDPRFDILLEAFQNKEV